MLIISSFKGAKHGELLFGRNKLLTLAVGKSQTSRSGGIVIFLIRYIVYILCSVYLFIYKRKIFRVGCKASSKREVYRIGLFSYPLCGLLMGCFREFLCLLYHEAGLLV